ncbi:hypothetical protein M427DRAFT_141055 [Gonapodya prolifera JEL478]|uniref:BZIP domain-containing protein n=1 Tax=Gonapodya prolifera (strain JEL478) TaxID=1344416 RepID=A0A138ZXV9_GONPJ|nr:hypothetical protein M427DRAFT_141055 [Gonapodya prolifera JEL478]|eukprot:KXS09337.1 hypothetical protein M427DRAFT_141055 [Gonapodya prolifera JEL478]
MPPVRDSYGDSEAEAPKTSARERNRVAQKAWRLKKQREQVDLRTQLEAAETLSSRLQAENAFLKEENSNLASQVRLLTDLVVRLSGVPDSFSSAAPAVNGQPNASTPAIRGSSMAPSVAGSASPSAAPSIATSEALSPAYEPTFSVDDTFGAPETHTFNLQQLVANELKPEEQASLRASMSKSSLGESWIANFNPYSALSVKPNFFHDWSEWPASTVAALGVLANHVATGADPSAPQSFDPLRGPTAVPVDVTAIPTPDLYSILVPCAPEVYATLSPELRASFIQLTNRLDRSASPCPILRAKLRETRRFLLKLDGVGEEVDVLDLLANLDNVAEEYRNAICLSVLKSIEDMGSPNEVGQMTFS